MSQGIKETKEVIIAVNMLSVELIKALKDGPQMADVSTLFTALTTNEEFKVALYAAYMDISKVPSEVKEIDLAGGLELAQVQLSFVPKIVEAIKA